MLSIATGIQDFPDSAYPLVHDQPDPVAARKAWSSINALLDYRAQHQGDKPDYRTGTVRQRPSSCWNLWRQQRRLLGQWYSVAKIVG